MMIHSRNFITELDEQCIQPNAVDLRIERVYKLQSTVAYLLDQSKVMRELVEQEAVPNVDGKDVFILPVGVYQFDTRHDIAVPEGHAGWVIGRSTLQRNGVFVTSSLYDSGYNNNVGGVIYNFVGDLVIEKRARVAQFVMMDAETAHLYDGQWQTMLR